MLVVVVGRVGGGRGRVGGPQDLGGDGPEATRVIQAAGVGAAKALPPTTDYRVSIVNAPGREAYPISSFTWILVYANQTDATKGKKLVDFLRWAFHEGEGAAGTLDYAPLPVSMISQLDKRLTTVKLGTVGMR